MASVFTFDPDPPRVSSPWGTPGTSTPQPAVGGEKARIAEESNPVNTSGETSILLSNPGIKKLEAEPQEGATEYKLHLLLRPRRSFSFISTNQLVSGSHHSKPRLSNSSLQPKQDVIENSQRLPQGSSNQTRQHRLQQLTTQLLWRLQQSSPYHSSSTADLVLPVLPEATPQLDVPKSPGKLLAGLEESQGALYEIGVSDDGTFVGLADDEMNESLTNLRAMAASLGCKVVILRRVAVGSCEWLESDILGKASPKLCSETLWVAEALVKPDLSLNGDDVDVSNMDMSGNGDSHAGYTASTYLEDGELQSSTEQVRISVTGATTSGKSSLIGTLSTSTLDNGRGKSRLSLLKHRHEIASGITSSVSQELVGYSGKLHMQNVSADVINYASGNVSSWNDIHARSEGGRLAFISDSAGHPRYQKTILRSLLSWNPHWTFMCVAANDCEENLAKAGAAASAQDVMGLAAAGLDLSIAHLDLCLALKLPLVVVITKLDLASKAGLRRTLTKILSVLKSAGRKPLMLSTSADSTDNGLDLQQVSKADKQEVASAIATLSADSHQIVPIVFTSSVNGIGIGKVHALLKALPVPSQGSLDLLSACQGPRVVPPTLFHIDEVFEIPPSKIYIPDVDTSHRPSTGIILSGHLRYGVVSIGDELAVGPLPVDAPIDAPSAEAMYRSRSFPERDTSPRILPKTSGSPKNRLLSASYKNSTPALDNNRVQPVSRADAIWVKVKVVSLRNLRLPVRKLLAGQVGTIGIEQSSLLPMTSSSLLSRIRKGHVLAHFNEVNSPSSSSGFVASFPPGTSSVLIVGLSATIYTASIRVAAKISQVSSPSTLDKSAVRSTPPTASPDLFSFDDSDPGSDGDSTSATSSVATKTRDSSAEEARVWFSFVSSTEWVEPGTKIFVMPVTGSVAAGSGVTGLEGFAGRIAGGL